MQFRMDKRFDQAKLELDYPCPWLYTLIGSDEDVMRAAVAELMGGHEHSLRLSHKSRTGKYTSLELEIIARDEAHRLETYAALKRHGTFKFVF